MQNYKKMFKLSISLLAILIVLMMNSVWAISYEEAEDVVYKEYKAESLEDISTIIDKEKQFDTRFLKVDVSDLNVKVKDLKKALANKSDKEFPYLKISELYGDITDLESDAREARALNTVFEIEYNVSNAQRMAVEKKMDAWIAKNIKEKDTDYIKVKKIHDYIMKNTVYIQGNGKTKNGYSVYSGIGVLMDGQGVCNGYTEAFQMLAKKVGLKSYKVIGQKQGEIDPNILHAWNLVKINNNYYHLDITWDDTGDGPYKYFLKSDKQMLKTHMWETGKYVKAVSNYIRK